MTINGTINKIGLMLSAGDCSRSLYLETWLLGADPGRAGTLAIVGAIGGFIMALITVFQPKIIRHYSTHLCHPGGSVPGCHQCSDKCTIPRSCIPGSIADHWNTVYHAVSLPVGHGSGPLPNSEGV